MKKFLFLAVAFAALMCGCGDDEVAQNTKQTDKVTKVADYLYEVEIDNYSDIPPVIDMSKYSKRASFGCSSVRNGNFFGRNLDFNITETSEFVVRTKATAKRKHASIGVANPIFFDVTNQMVSQGLDDETLEFIAWMMMDGINDAGLACNINVVDQADLGDNPHLNTNPGKPSYMAMNLIRYLLDNCASVDEAIREFDNINVTPIPSTWDGHLMISDPQKTVVVEFVEGGIKVTQTNIMTNFYNFIYEENLQKPGATPETAFPSHSCGIERYNILKENYAQSGESMVKMRGLLEKVHYLQAYDLNTTPFWCSEFYSVIPGCDTSWTEEDIMNQPEVQKEILAYKRYAADGYYEASDNLWFTCHNSTYDLVQKELWVTIREKYDAYYKFKL